VLRIYEGDWGSLWLGVSIRRLGESWMEENFTAKEDKVGREDFTLLSRLFGILDDPSIPTFGFFLLRKKSSVRGWKSVVG
jgi:hypothetical protein